MSDSHVGLVHTIRQSLRLDVDTLTSEPAGDGVQDDSDADWLRVLHVESMDADSIARVVRSFVGRVRMAALF